MDTPLLADSFVALLKKSGLVPNDLIDSAVASLGVQDATPAKEVARGFLKRGLVTRFQAERLLEGSPAVLALFRKIPYRDAPPDYIRLVVYRYHFSDPATKRATGRWWDRMEIGRSEPMTLRR